MSTSSFLHGAETSALGQSVVYCDRYAPGLLFPIDRQLKRTEIGVNGGTGLPFIGEDLWNGYELSWLNPKGKPVVALARFRVPAETPRLIESKSFKLYLNSFNQTIYGNKAEVAAVLSRDLSEAAGGLVSVAIFLLNERPVYQSAYPDGVCLDELDVEIQTYMPAPELLRISEKGEIEETLYSHLLKSNCLVTGQPDWGMFGVRYRGPAIDRESLLRYIVSFRQHNEFHEQCVERIFCDIRARCRPVELLVWARYTRRGGLDINPWRATPGCDWMPDESREVRQ